MGISKSELFREYYMDEIGEILYEYNRLHRPPEEQPEAVSSTDFFGF